MYYYTVIYFTTMSFSLCEIFSYINYTTVKMEIQN